MKMPKLHADGIFRVFKRMHWEFTNILWPELKSHMTPLALLPFTHQYWNVFTERCRIQVAAYYNEAFKNIEQVETPGNTENSTHIYHQYTLKISDVCRDDLKDFLAGENIPSMIYYPVPLHRQNAFLHYEFDDDKYPVTNELSDIVLSLPIHTEMEETELKYITDKLFNGIKELS